ncbi:DNA/RNA non-specific endonuclease [Pseudobutyrivibrio ruminis]|uniref:DNA/RNA non-specific endonuclease n=1 Tax=Pseudobutyrivibrio ruminis TaxID=46206 RepID=UPI000402ACA7|nr:DNA/RNA non-specific endonuclease [Pseudobutyrivibrio ruminis]
MEDLITGRQYKWDSKKEYDKFWRKSVKQKKNRQIKFVAIVLCAFIVVLIFTRVVFNKHTVMENNADTFSASIVDIEKSEIPEYGGELYIELNGNKPGFTKYDINNLDGEMYSPLDRLGRCGTAFVMLEKKMMPTEERQSIGYIKPSGWHQEKYPGIVDSEPPYLYNRCHLIAYALTGQNGNELNLITGTRYFNVEGMLPFEEEVMKYLDNSSNHVLYRVSPYFEGEELVARGVEMEAYSVEDDGEGVCFHVFVYNVQPGIDIDYLTGESKKNKE